MSNSSLESISTAGTSEKTGLSHIISPSSNFQRGEEYQAKTLHMLETNRDVLFDDMLQELTGGFDRLKAMRAELKRDASLSELNQAADNARKVKERQLALGTQQL